MNAKGCAATSATPDFSAARPSPTTSSNRTVTLIADRSSGPAGRTVVVNPLGWARPAVVDGRLVEVPAAGYTVLTGDEPAVTPVTVEETDQQITLTRGEFRVSVDRARGVVSAINGLGCGPHGLGRLRRERDGQEEWFAPVSTQVDGDRVVVVHRSPAGDEVRLTVSLAPERDAVDLTFTSEALVRPDGRHHASLMTLIEPDLAVHTLLHDTPYAVTPVVGRGRYQRKYPTGDWMTSPQVFETVVDPFTGLQLVDLLDETGAGLLWLHDGSQGFLRAERGMWNVLSMYDPWDEDHFVPELHARMRVFVHHGLDHATRWRLAQEFTRPVLVRRPDRDGGDLPASFSQAQLTGHSGAVLTALFRETGYAAAGMTEHVSTRVDRPVLARLVEFTGEAGTAELVIDGTVAQAWRTSALGEIQAPLPVTSGPNGTSRVAVELRAYEIATLALDLVEARKQARDLDAHRNVWATVHRIEEES